MSNIKKQKSVKRKAGGGQLESDDGEAYDNAIETKKGGGDDDQA